ncbi:MAG: hypothetical protein AB7P03_26650 [Kofleriaceae bacterium]
MKTLDDEVPSGYFEGLPNRTLARLGDGSMQTTGPDMRAETEVDALPPEASGGVPKQDRDEDSGLHDIRSLASSTKARLSSRRSSQHPIPSDDVLANSSAGWKAVALPEPAKMVSLPELASLPTKTEIERLDREHAEHAEHAAASTSATSMPASMAASMATSTAAELDDSAGATASAVERAPAMAPFGARITAQRSSGGRGKMIAVLGAVVAAAAGGVFYVAVYNKAEAPTVASVAPEPSRAAEPMPTLARAPEVKPIDPEPDPAPVVAPAPPPSEDVADDKHGATDADQAAKKPAKEPHKVKIEYTSKPEPVKPPEPPKPAEEPAKKSDESEPSFDALLKEAGVSDEKKVAKPVLAKKSLNSDDIKTGMSNVESAAKACYAGQQGTAKVKLTVAPSGKVTKVAVSGAFAGTSVGTCVEAAVRSATFPPWDGGPQSFNYSYLLAE